MRRSEIQAVLFDVGGVLVPTDSSNRLFEERVESSFGVSGFSYDSPRYPFVPGLFRDLETGIIDDRTFWTRLAAALGKPPVPELENFFPDVGASGDIGPFFREEITLLRSRGILTAIVSNTCQSLAERHYRMGHYDLVDIHILSHEAGLHKPSREFFSLVLDRTKVRAESALLVDDRGDNVRAAREFGMPAIQYTSDLQLTEEFVARGLPIPETKRSSQ
jgi:FMN phosphatase YigB (HAD superfamily)